MLAALLANFLIVLAAARGPTPLHEPLIKVSSSASRPPNYKVREIVVESESDQQCPNGYEQTGGNCLKVESLPVTFQCRPGWQMNAEGTGCFGFSAVAPDHNCVEGAAQGNRCIVEQTAPKLVNCPVGSRLTSNMEQCVKEILHPGLPVCPPGARYANGVCVATRNERPRLRCPSDYTLDRNACTHIYETTPILQCPSDYALTGGVGREGGMGGGKEGSGGGMCFKMVYTQPGQRCPLGFNLAGGDCVSETHIPPTMVCSKGELMDGDRCMVIKEVAPRTVCGQGLALNALSQMCERNDIKPPMAECTKGTIFNPVLNQCGSSHKLKQPNLACPPNYRFSGKNHCVALIVEPQQKLCPPGFQLMSKDRCVSKTVVHSEPRCPPGAVLRDRLCVISNMAPYEKVCEAGSILEGKSCVMKALAQALARCPPDYLMTPEGRCVHTETVAPTPVCPPETIQRADASGLVCSTTVTTPATSICPPAHQVHVGGDCLEQVHLPPLVTCPPGYNEEVRSGRCFRAEAVPRQSFCPVGFHLVGSQCLKRELDAPMPLCPPSYKLVQSDMAGAGLPGVPPPDALSGLGTPLAGTAAMGVSAAASSGLGFAYLCVQELTAPMINICAFGFEYKDGSCSAKKLQYEFDEEAAEPEGRPEEELKDLEGPAAPQAAPEPEIEITVDRPVVQKGLVMRNEPITLSGPASEVARQQAVLKAGGDVKDLHGNIQVEYAAPSQPATAGPNLFAMLSQMRTLFNY